MSLKERIQNSMKDAMRAKDKPRLDAIRLITASIKQYEVDERKDATDDVLLALLDKMVKQRRDAVKQYNDANRPELAEKENFEITIIQEFLPQPLSNDEIAQLIDDAIAKTSADSMKDMGKVMGVLKPQLQGRADMGAVSQLIKAKLS